MSLKKILTTGRSKFLFALSVLLALVFTLQSDFLRTKDTDQTSSLTQYEPVLVSEASDIDFKKLEVLMANLNQDLNQPNILKDDIMRGWYLSSKEGKKYGTPESWIFVEDGPNSKWMSPNSMEDVEVDMAGEMCRETGGKFTASCLETADDQCEYVGVSRCECPQLTKWNESQGCILVNEKGSYIAINSQELEQGYYYGLPTEKKLNTPSDWIWTENGPKSSWHSPRKIY